MSLEHKYCPPGAELKVDDNSVISGYASIFGRKDHGGDIVGKGAYSASLGKMQAAGGKVKMLWQHDPAQPIGVWDEVREDSTGLWVKGRMPEDITLREMAAVFAAARAALTQA